MKADRIKELNALARKAHEDGHRKEYKMLMWRSHILSTTGTEPTELEAIEAFKC